MKSLKDILSEGMLGDIDDILAKGDKLIDKALKKALIDKIHKNWVVTVDQDTYNQVMDLCTEQPSNAKKGSQWVFVLPDIKNGASFKPIMANVKKGLWRVPMDKEMYSTTTSAMHKRLTKITNGYKKYDLSNAFILPGSVYTEMFFMTEYTYVKTSNIDDDWYTYALFDHTTRTYSLLSFNPDTKKWSYGGNKNIPANALLGKDNITNEWYQISRSVIDSIKETGGGSYQDGIVYNSSLKYFLSLKKGDISDYKKNPDNWIKIIFGQSYLNNWSRWDSSQDQFVYIHKTNFSVITESALMYDTIVKNNGWSGK
jgi:hypothetical protein